MPTVSPSEREEDGMARFIGLHTIPGFTREMLAQATPALEQSRQPEFLKAYTSFREGKVVCEWESGSKDEVAKAYSDLGFPYDDIVEVEAICDTGKSGVTTTFV
jgi:Protein of unknown function (DUF4242)